MNAKTPNIKWFVGNSVCNGRSQGIAGVPSVLVNLARVCEGREVRRIPKTPVKKY